MFPILSTILFLVVPLIAIVWRFGVSFAKGQALGEPKILLAPPPSLPQYCSSLTPGNDQPWSWIKLENQSLMKGRALKFRLNDGFRDNFVLCETSQDLFGLKQLHSHARIPKSWERSPRKWRFTFAPGLPWISSWAGLNWGRGIISTSLTLQDHKEEYD